LDTVARFSNDDRRDLFLATSEKMQIPPGHVEKDFWVCWVLDALFASHRWSDKMIFKGGTSLSKIYRLINRFSEDIDLILDWQLLGVAKDDYKKMGEMIFGTPPPFEKIVETLQGIEAEINSLR
jgi:hypothetical protein